MGLQGLENLFKKSQYLTSPVVPKSSYLKLNLGLSDILLAAAAAGNLLGLGDLGADGLGRKFRLA